MVVPRIVDKATLLVNIHEYVHALEFYRNMGKKLVLNVQKSEEEARGFEAEYIKKSESIKINIKEIKIMHKNDSNF